MRPLSISPWNSASTSDGTEIGVQVFAIDTPNTQDRRQARALVRSALIQRLAEYLACAADSIQLSADPGMALRLVQPARDIGLSVSHDAGCSVAAINLRGPVGIDLIRLPAAGAGWSADIPHLADDYLAPDCARHLQHLPPQAQAIQFAQEWTAQEARLKCLGLGLTEWNPSLQQQLAKVRTFHLRLHAGLIGSLALPEFPHAR